MRTHRWICPFLWRYSSPSSTSFKMVAMLASSSTPVLCSPREMICLMMSSTEPASQAQACHHTCVWYMVEISSLASSCTGLKCRMDKSYRSKKSQTFKKYIQQTKRSFLTDCLVTIVKHPVTNLKRALQKLNWGNVTPEKLAFALTFYQETLVSTSLCPRFTESQTFMERNEL